MHMAELTLSLHNEFALYRLPGCLLRLSWGCRILGARRLRRKQAESSQSEQANDAQVAGKESFTRWLRGYRQTRFIGQQMSHP